MSVSASFGRPILQESSAHLHIRRVLSSLSADWSGAFSAAEMASFARRFPARHSQIMRSAFAHGVLVLPVAERMICGRGVSEVT